LSFDLHLDGLRPSDDPDQLTASGAQANRDALSHATVGEDDAEVGDLHRATDQLDGRGVARVGDKLSRDVSIDDGGARRHGPERNGAPELIHAQRLHAEGVADLDAPDLEEAGVVRGYHADLDAEALGYNVHVFAFVGLTSQAEVDLQAFEELVAAWPQVRECHMLMGETDFLLKIVAHDWDDFQKFLTSKLTPAKNVSHVKTALSIRSAKKLAGVPVDAERASD